MRVLFRKRFNELIEYFRRVLNQMHEFETNISMNGIKINSKLDVIDNCISNINDKVKWQSNENKYLKSNVENIITSQQRTIEQLIRALCDKYEHGLFIFSEDGKIPMVIRNGKDLTNDMTTSFHIDWCPGEIPEIHIDQCAATHRDMEE